MSHFTVMVRLTEQRLSEHDTLDEALEEILAPFKEGVDEGSLFAEFDDVTDEYHARYETEVVERVRYPDGSLTHPCDDRFRKPGLFAYSREYQYEIPKDCQTVQVSWKECYSTFEDFMREWAGYKPNTDGRYGSWINKSAKWDWYMVGGRWRGFFPIRTGVTPVIGHAGTFDNKPSGGSDLVRRDQIDFDRAVRIGAGRFAGFVAGYQKFLAGVSFPAFDEPRDEMLRMGMLRIEENPMADLRAGEVQVGARWGEMYAHLAGTVRASWRDVALTLTDDQLARYRSAFNPLVTFAVLDDAGWHAPGRMGWFGCSSEKPDEYLAYCKTFVERFIEPIGDDDKLALVDCHI